MEFVVNKDTLLQRMILIEQEIRKYQMSVNEQTCHLHELIGVKKELGYLIAEYFKDDIAVDNQESISAVEDIPS
jgi:hypothetical protein